MTNTREILCRGKVINNRVDKNDKWIEGYFVQRYDEDGELKTYIAHILYGEEYAEVHPETVCEYAGLRDAVFVSGQEGNRVFENDIVLGIDDAGNESLCVVVYEHCHFYGKAIKGDEEGNQDVNFFYDGDVIIKGNIFDNPELLEGE